jgi:hypothetical protein
MERKLEHRPIPADHLTRSLYFASRLTSQAGQGLFFALLVVIAGPGDSGALGLGSVMIAMTVAAIALGPLGGDTVDRLGARLALPVGAALRLAAIAMAVVVLEAGSAVWIVALLYSAASQIFSPAELALVSTLRRGRPAGTHASLFALQFGGQAVGAFVFAPLLFWLNGRPAMLGGALAIYILVVVIASALSARLAGVEHATVQRRPHERVRFWSTLRFIGAEPRALYAVGLLGLVDLTTRCLMIAAPIYLQSELHLGRAHLAMLALVGAVGALLGLGGAARWVTTRQAPTVMRMALGALLVSTFALTPLGDGLGTLTVSGADIRFEGFAEPMLIGTLAAVPAVLILGLTVTAAPIIARSVLTTVAPEGQQGRVFAAEAVVSNVLVVPALLLAALSTDVISARATVMFIGLVGSAVFALLEYRALGRFAAPLKAAADPEPAA